MPKRTDIHTVLIIGAGPIVIGQACEFDYSGAQACKALREEGYRVVLVNSNPATIMTDPDMADATYIEPITPEFVEKIIARERPNVPAGKVFALLPTMGGQTALNTALSLAQDRRAGAPQCRADRRHRRRHRQGRGPRALQAGHGQDRPGRAQGHHPERPAAPEEGFSAATSSIDGNNAPVMELGPETFSKALAALDQVGLPTVIRPSFTMGGTGGGIAYNREEFFAIVEGGLEASPTNEVLIEESVLGWKEFEMEVVRDKADNAIIICSIENIDAMGVHTGDSITIAPALTLTDKEYQRMRSASIAVLREIGVETGGSNVQFAVNPKDGRMVVIEMNPRVSRSIGAGLQGHRLSHRQDRGQAGLRLHAGRTQERHHQGDAGQLRADHRLCGDQDSALRLREIPRRRAAADHLDEIGGRSHGHRPHLWRSRCRRRCARWKPA